VGHKAMRLVRPLLGGLQVPEWQELSLFCRVCAGIPGVWLRELYTGYRRCKGSFKKFASASCDEIEGKWGLLCRRTKRGYCIVREAD
jgi:hypothetical protein